MASPAVPIDHASDDRSRHGLRPSRYNCSPTTSDIRTSATGRMAEIQAPEMPLAGRLSPTLATVR